MHYPITFDTLAYVNKLKEAGFSEPQAVAQARALAEAMSNMTETNLATKDDISALRRDIDELRHKTKEDIDELRLATKEDFDELRLATKEDINQLHISTKEEIGNLRTEIHKIENKMTVRMGAITAAGITILSSVMVLLHIHP